MTDRLKKLKLPLITVIGTQYNMESLAESYQLPFESFKDLLQLTNSLVAGSTALALYLQENHIDPGFEPNDMDIWIEDTDQYENQYEGYSQTSNFYMFSNFLNQNHYETIHIQHPYNNLSGIKEIVSFENPRGKKIQLIFLTKGIDLYRYIYDNFDLSVCMTWYDPFNNNCVCLYPEETLQKTMYYFPSTKTDREVQRLNKYRDRGFLLLESPCRAQYQRDDKKGLEKLASYSAHDVISYEDVNCTTFLKESAWHVLLLVGEQFYAYHRSNLHKYITEHVILHPSVGFLYDTPTKQSIDQSTAQYLSFSDYSIVELVPEYTINYERDSKTVYCAKFFTVEQWTTDPTSPGMISSPPLLQASNVRDIYPDIPLIDI